MHRRRQRACRRALGLRQHGGAADPGADRRADRAAQRRRGRGDAGPRPGSRSGSRRSLPAQKRPTPIAVAPGSTDWRPGTAYRGYFADPDILRYGDRWFAYATNTSHLRLPTLVSRDLRTWTPLTDAGGARVDPLQPASWVSARNGGQSLWAPGVDKVGDGWTAAYAAPAGTTGGERHNCIGLSRASSPAGPFRAVGEPLCYGRARTRRHRPGRLRRQHRRPVAAVEVLRDRPRAPRGPFHPPGSTGRAPASRRARGPSSLLTLVRGWEGITIENPSMVQFRGVTYLFYSGNSYEDGRYATGYAICAGPEGPCVRQNHGNPLLSTASTGNIGPGGASAFVDGTSLRLIYHAWDHLGGLRRLHVAGLWQRPDGTLEVVDPG
ncbi:family 43 glycosylhydrolase [Nocardioides sp. W3-2-3]|nr:family 43 glycosylhydrolase [Nocardioides convexus]